MKVFKLGNENFNGLFNYFRNTRPSLISFVKTKSFEAYIASELCQGGYTSSESAAIIDGNRYSSWSNLNTDTPVEQEVTIDLGINKFQLKLFELATPCGSPQILEILGSNNGDSYSRICLLEGFQEDYSISNNTCDCIGKSYRLFKIKQHENNAGKYRLHICEIEFYGILNNDNINTCQKCNFSYHIFYFICIIIMK